MPRRTIVFLLVAALSALVCVRLGMWQLSRLNERRARNAFVSSRLDSAAVAPAELPADTTLARFRRVRATGTYDYENELYITGRSLNGSPGVYLVTPLRLGGGGGGDTTLLVNRGWVYAPDGLTVPSPERWREGEGARTVTGYAETYPRSLGGRVSVSSNARAIRWLDPRAFALPARSVVLPFYLVARDSTPAARRDSTPVRLRPPALDEGSHLSYAIQWFSFAVIAVVGGGFYLAAQRRGVIRAAGPRGAG